MAAIHIGYSDNAPVDFQVSSSEESDVETYNFDTLKNTGQCPLCRKLREEFVCSDCIRANRFHHSSVFAGRLREKYGELKQKLAENRHKKKTLLVKCEEHTNKKEKIARIVNEIQACENRIFLQKELKRVLEHKLNESDKLIEVTKKSSNEKVKNWPLYRTRLDNMLTQHRHKVAKLNKYISHIQNRKAYLQSVTKTRILQLKEYVFPIEQTSRDSLLSVSTPPTPRQAINTGLYSDLWDDVDEDDDTVSALMAATSQYIGRIEPSPSPHNAGENCFHVIPAPYGPTLSSSGDYSAYTEWVNKGMEKSSGVGTLRNPAHCISSGLTYTTQFVNLIAYYLDLRLPHRLSYSEFTNSELTGGKFYRKVAKLNANVIHLCASQLIPPSRIQPRKTIPNLLLLFDSSVADLGRRGPFEVSSQLAKSMEQSIEKDLVIFEEDSSESESDWSDSNFPSDWENVQRGTITEMSAENMTAHNNSQSYLQRSYQNTTSDIFQRSKSNSSAGIMASVTSFFKGWGS